MPALCSPRGLWCAGATATARSGAMTLALGILAGRRWHTPTPIPKPGRRCRPSTGAGGASSAGSAITLAFGHHEDRTPTRGYEPTREAAMAAFAKSWRREEPMTNHHEEPAPLPALVWAVVFTILLVAHNRPRQALARHPNSCVGDAGRATSYSR